MPEGLYEQLNEHCPHGWLFLGKSVQGLVYQENLVEDDEILDMAGAALGLLLGGSG